MTYVTESDIPFKEAFYMDERFVLLNMFSQGVWYVDREHSKWEEIKNSALLVAKTFGDQDQIDKLQKIDAPTP